MPRQIDPYGWIPDLPDQRDYFYASPYQEQVVLPSAVDLRAACPPIYDQGQLASSTANAIAAAIEFDEMRELLSHKFTPSRLFTYYNARVIERTVNSDSGAMIRDGLKSVAALGVCTESEWPYDITKFAVRPPDYVYQEASEIRALVYQRMRRDLSQMKGCLASGAPFIFGFTVYESFESQQVALTGQVPMPMRNEIVLGGHAVLAVGYDDIQQLFLVRNSWGTSWGMQGYFTMPYAYLTHEGLSSDFWTIRIVR